VNDLRGSDQHGQAQIEFVAMVPVLIGVAALIVQLLAVGYTQSLADGAAEAGAHAIAAGLPPEPAVRAALPGWAADEARVTGHGGEVEVSLATPSLIGEVGRRLTVDSTAWARPGEG
jgi:Flp pilus assembly protein TadG